jgi:hypothetical protein
MLSHYRTVCKRVVSFCTLVDLYHILEPLQHKAFVSSHHHLLNVSQMWIGTCI